jgi:hypothetical protein
MSFTVPNNDTTLGPSDPDHAALQGVKVHVTQWALNHPDLFLPCCFCEHGELAPKRWDFIKNKKLTPIFDISGGTKWVAAMKCKCKCCNASVAGNDGTLTRKPPPHLRSKHPAKCAHARPGKFHLSRGTSCLLKKLLVTDGNG